MVRIAGKDQARKAAVSCRGEQLQRLPALTPSGSRLVSRIQDREVAALTGKEIADGEASLPPSDHDHLVAIGHDVHGVNLPIPVPATGCLDSCAQDSGRSDALNEPYVSPETGW